MIPYGCSSRWRSGASRLSNPSRTTVHHNPQLDSVDRTRGNRGTSSNNVGEPRLEIPDLAYLIPVKGHRNNYGNLIATGSRFIGLVAEWTVCTDCIAGMPFRVR